MASESRVHAIQAVDALRARTVMAAAALVGKSPSCSAFGYIYRGLSLVESDWVCSDLNFKDSVREIAEPFAVASVPG